MFGSESTNGLCLLQRRENTDVAVDDLSPGPPFGRGVPLIVKTQDDVSIVGNCATEQAPLAIPFVLNRGGRWFSVDIHQHGVFFRWIEVRRFDHPAIERDIAGNPRLEEFRWASQALVDLFRQLGVAF